MADPVPAQASSAPATPEPAAAPASAPLTTTAASSPTPEAPAAAPEPSTTAAPAAAPSPIVEKPAEPAPVQPAASVPTLLEDFDSEQKAKTAGATGAAPGTTGAVGASAAAPAQGASAAAAPGATGAAPPTQAAPVQQPVDYKYTLPETIKMDDGLKGQVHKAFDDFRANPSEGAQGLINLHEQEMRRFAQATADAQQNTFRNTRAQWRKDILADPELGGAGHRTAMGAIARMRDMLVPEKHRAAFENFLRVTGAGDHPEFLRILHQAARFYDEPGVQQQNSRPPPNNGAKPARRLRDIYASTRQSGES